MPRAFEALRVLLALLAFTDNRMGLSAMKFSDIGPNIGPTLHYKDARSRLRECMFLHCMARADIRVRVRPTVIRVRIAETAIRTVIRITAPVHNLALTPFCLPSSLVSSQPPLDIRGGRRMDSAKSIALDSRFHDFKELTGTVIQLQAEHRT